MKISLAGTIGGTPGRVLTWADGVVTGDDDALDAFRRSAAVLRGRTVHGVLGAIRAEPTTPRGFWVIARHAFDDVPTESGDELPTPPDSDDPNADY